MDELDAGRAARRRSCKHQYLDKKRQAVNLDLYRKQLREIEQLVRRAAEAAAEQVRDGSAAVDINQAGLGRGLQFELFKPAQQRDRCAISTPSCRSPSR